jgi:hypothetical protein
MAQHLRLIGLVCCGLIVSALSAAAQSPVYITGTGFADIKTFSGTEGNPYGSSSSQLGGTTAGGGFRIGTFLHPRWSLELAIDTGGKTEGSTQYPMILLADLPTSPRVPDFKQSVRFLTVSSLVGYHPAPRGRLRPGFLAGFSFVRGTYRSEYPNYYVLATGVLTRVNLSTVFPTIFPPPVFTTETITSTENTSAVALGFETAIDLQKHLAVVPEVRALAFSQRGAGVFLIRPGVGVRWSF